MSTKLIYLTAAVLAVALVGSAGAQPLGQGKVLFEYWMNISGTSVDTNLRTNANFPDKPTSSEWRDGFKSQSGKADNYGLRARAFLTPPQTGEYTFWVSGDDNCQLWLSTDDTAANATMIAQVPGWTGVEEWGKYPEQKSAPKALEAGKTYYIEALMKEGGGGDSLEAGWAGPGIGEATVIIGGQHVTAFIRDPEPLFKAQNPKPADKAVDITEPLFEWTAGKTAVMHDIYFGTNPTPGPAEYKGPMPIPMYFHVEPLVPGATYYWRIDEIDATGGKTVGDVWSFTVTPLTAHFPNPADGAKNVDVMPALRWTAGQGAIQHIVYLGKDKAALAPIGDSADPSYTLAAPLDPFATYYWRVDEVGATGTISEGPVWSFSTVDYVPLVSAQTALNYDNRAEPFISALDVAVPMADLTAGGRTADVAIRFQGAVHKLAEVEPGTYSITARSGDVWGATDNFRFFYRQLTGDGSIVARIHSQTRPNTDWAKAGVMIRQSLDPAAAHGFMVVTPNLRRAFQNRPVAAGNSVSAHSAANAIALPFWVKLERAGNQVTAFYSTDGVAWTKQPDTENTGGDRSPNPQTLELGETVYVGFAVTSNQTANTTTAVFSGLSATGETSGEWQLTDIGPFIPGNDPASLFVSLEDATGAVAAVAHPNPAATQITVMDLWRVPLSAFEGVDVKNVAAIQIGVGDGQPGGTGRVTIGDARVVQPVVSPDPDAMDVTMPGDPVVAVPDDGDWPAAEYPALAIDDKITTKFLHFKGEIQPTGIIVTPSIGYTLVTGLTFTSANDAVERDPAAFELYGSHVGPEGPWKLIAKGPVTDFIQPISWPRRWKTVTPIGFANSMPYACYKVLVTAVRTPTSANSMQVAEIELLGVVAEQPIIIDVVRANGQSGNRAPIGQYDGNTAPLATQPGGLTNGNYVFSDRTYTWVNTPAELVGAEYIRTFNSDKSPSEKDLTYTVTTSREATVAITVDDRIPAEWNAGGAVTSAQAAADYVTAAFAAPGTFVDTGLDLFVGGDSDRRMSVYAATLPAGTYVFGAMWSDKNFYTIGAMD